MKKVWKFSIDLDDHVTIDMPGGAELLHVGLQDGIKIWALVDPHQPLEKRRFRVAGTGHPIDVDVDPVGTVMDGRFVWHIFEELDYGTQ